MTPKTVLVVDDDPRIHQLLAAVLATTAWQMESAFDGDQGLARVEARPYDLVLTDIRMPGLDGLELMRRIRQLRPETKVIVMTGDSTTSDVIRSLRDQAFAYFSKPFSAATLRDMLAKAAKSPSEEGDIEVLSATPEWIGLRVRCRVDVADRVLQFLRELKMDLPEKQREEIAMAFKEMLMNAIEHGGRLDPAKRIYVSYVRTSRAILYHIRDPGSGFSLEDLPHAAISNPPEAPTEHLERREELGMRPGGFGILLVRNLVDELIYNEKGNEVILIRYLQEDREAS
ncbi:MAG: response regulator [Acidobacteria bacterium]|nr:response regulator [Acidobacteriota bacterium]